MTNIFHIIATHVFKLSGPQDVCSKWLKLKSLMEFAVKMIPPIITKMFGWSFDYCCGTFWFNVLGFNTIFGLNELNMFIKSDSALPSLFKQIFCLLALCRYDKECHSTCYDFFDLFLSIESTEFDCLYQYQYFNALRPRQNSHHLAEDSLRFIYLDEI